MIYNYGQSRTISSKNSCKTFLKKNHPLTGVSVTGETMDDFGMYARQVFARIDKPRHSMEVLARHF